MDDVTVQGVFFLGNNILFVFWNLSPSNRCLCSPHHRPIDRMPDHVKLVSLKA